MGQLVYTGQYEFVGDDEVTGLRMCISERALSLQYWALTDAALAALGKGIGQALTEEEIAFVTAAAVPIYQTDYWRDRAG